MIDSCVVEHGLSAFLQTPRSLSMNSLIFFEVPFLSRPSKKLSHDRVPSIIKAPLYFYREYKLFFHIVFAVHFEKATSVATVSTTSIYKLIKYHGSNVTRHQFDFEYT